MPASPQDWACRLLAATLLASGLTKFTSILRDGAFGPPQDEGGWRAEKRKILMARALRHAGAFRRANHGVFRHRALLSSGPSRIECADRSVSQLLAGTPSGPGGSSNAARVPRCDEARRRRTPSRLTTPHETPLTGRGEASYARFGDGDMRGYSPTLVIPAKAGIQGRTHQAWIPARRYDGVFSRAAVTPPQGGPARYCR